MNDRVFWSSVAFAQRNAQILPLDSWKSVPVPGSPDAAIRAVVICKGGYLLTTSSMVVNNCVAISVAYFEIWVHKLITFRTYNTFGSFKHALFALNFENFLFFPSFYIFFCSIFVFNIRVSAQEDKVSPGDQDCK